jgi:hypothetical protein
MHYSRFTLALHRIRDTWFILAATSASSRHVL